MRSGTAYRRQPLAPLTAVTGSSLSAPETVPTPNASNFEIKDVDRLLARHEECRIRNRNGNGFGLTLGQWVQLWPTPVAKDAIGARNATSSRQPDSRHHGGSTLTDAVIQTGDLTLEETEKGNRVVGGALNPTWVEWLMGFPLGWTDCEDSETP
jgi:hypothetical protein